MSKSNGLGGSGTYLTIEALRESISLTNSEINELVHNSCK